jgi:hypothetical protein
VVPASGGIGEQINVIIITFIREIGALMTAVCQLNVTFKVIIISLIATAHREQSHHRRGSALGIPRALLVGQVVFLLALHA